MDNENSTIQGILKSKQYRYRLANSSMIRAKELAIFVKFYFSGHVPSKKEWQDFFVDLLREYSLNGKTPKVKIVDLEKFAPTSNNTDNPQLTLGGYISCDPEKGIYLSSKTIENLSNKNYSLMSAVSTLMHEFRHFYQYEAHSEIRRKTYRDILGDEFENINRGINMPLISRSEKIKEICQIIHLITDKCDFIERILNFDYDKQKVVLYYIAHCCYYYMPHERDARAFSEQMMDVVFADMWEELDDETKILIEKDYSEMQDKSKENIALNKATQYYIAFKKSIKNLSLKEMEMLGQNMIDKKDYCQLFLGLLNVVFGDDSKEEQYRLCTKSILYSCPCLFNNLFKIFKFDKKQLSVMRKIAMFHAEQGILSTEMIVELSTKEELFTRKNVQDLLLNSIRKDEFECALQLYDEWMYREFTHTKESNFVDELLLTIEKKVDEILIAPNYEEKHLNMARILQIILQRVDEDGYVLSDDVKVSKILCCIKDILDSVNERG